MEPSEKQFVPYVPASKHMAELTFKALFLGIAMAIVLGAANAFVGMKAGLTVAATFPAAVVAMAALRVFGGTILEENIARTTASVGEALVAGAIFTIPAFVLSGAWERLHYWESTAIMLIGGVLGVLFIIVLRRTMVVEADLPFPESVAASEIVKAGQGGQTGAKYLFGAMGIAGLWELLKNQYGLQFFSDTAQGFFSLGKSKISIGGQGVDYQGGLLLQTPQSSLTLMGVGFIVGPRVSSVLFAGAVFGWLLLVPLAMFLSPDLMSQSESLVGLANEIWSRQVRPLAVGTMIVAAFYTLWNLRGSLVAGITKAVRDLDVSGGGDSERTNIDLDLRKIFVAIGVVAVPTFFLYHYFAQNLLGSLLLTVVMVIIGFFFAAVAGYLVGLIGSSNNPISGLTLSALLISAVLMVALGVTGNAGVAAVLGVAGVVCCACGIAGDMMQDLKVGHILGGTPWRMEVAELIGVGIAAMVMAPVLIVLDKVYVIGSATLPAPQAGLMALLAKGIVGGEMAWPLVIVGMFLAVALILIKAPSPMLIAVGMYLPFFSTAAIFVGGLIKWLLEVRMKKAEATPEEKLRAENTGTLVSSGFIAGESVMAVIIALAMGGFFLANPDAPDDATMLPHIGSAFWPSLLAYPIALWLLVRLPLKKMREPSLPVARIE